MSTAMNSEPCQGGDRKLASGGPYAVAYAVARDRARHFPPILLCSTTAHEPAPPASYTYATAANGLFLRVESALFGATLPLVGYPVMVVRGLEPLAPAITLHVPRVPVALLATMAGEALVAAATSGHEALWQVQWPAGSGAGPAWAETAGNECASGGGWQLVRPAQVSSPGQVRYDATAPGVLLTVHSHGRGGATYFSTTDDADDMGLSFQGVIGDLCRPDRRPRLLLRLCAFGYRWPVPPHIVFACGRFPASLAAVPPLFGTAAETGWTRAGELAVDLLPLLTSAGGHRETGDAGDLLRRREGTGSAATAVAELGTAVLPGRKAQVRPMMAEPPALWPASAPTSPPPRGVERPAENGIAPAGGRRHVLPGLRRSGSMFERLTRRRIEEGSHER